MESDFQLKNELRSFRLKISLRIFQIIFSLHFCKRGSMKSWKVLSVIALVLVTISWFIVSQDKKSFSVLSQRVDTKKSAALTKKWDGSGSFVDMIWQ